MAVRSVDRKSRLLVCCLGEGVVKTYNSVYIKYVDLIRREGDGLSKV